MENTISTTCKIENLLKSIDDATEYIGPDGLIYCKNCKTPRMYINHETALRIKCDCQRAEIQKERELEQTATRQYQISQMRVNSLLKGEYLTARFDNTDVINADDSFVKAMARCRKYCEKSEEVKRRGLGIYFYGGIGVGKTRLMACMANELIDKGYQVLFTNQMWINERLRTRKYTSDTLNTLDKLTDIDFLFIDELIADIKDCTPLYNIINSRTISKKPTLISSNYSLGQIGEVKGYDAIVSRILQLNTVFNIKGSDYRIKTRQSNEKIF